MMLSQYQLICKHLIWKPSYQYSDETFICKRKYSIDKILLSKVSSCNTLRNPIDRCFREANVLSDFRVANKADAFWKYFYEEFI